MHTHSFQKLIFESFPAYLILCVISSPFGAVLKNHTVVWVFQFWLKFLGKWDSVLMRKCVD